jgi:hypothetical protein
MGYDHGGGGGILKRWTCLDRLRRTEASGLEAETWTPNISSVGQQ